MVLLTWNFGSRPKINFYDNFLTFIIWTSRYQVSDPPRGKKGGKPFSVAALLTTQNYERLWIFTLVYSPPSAWRHTAAVIADKNFTSVLSFFVVSWNNISQHNISQTFPYMKDERGHCWTWMISSSNCGAKCGPQKPLSKLVLCVGCRSMGGPRLGPTHLCMLSCVWNR